jgi:agmatine deiminase
VKDENGKSLITHWIYNAWGNKWAHDLDQKIPTEISKITGISEIKTHMVLEGGSIDVNGKGLLLTTESCLLNKNRNPKLTKQEIENHLNQYLGIEKVLWLRDGIVGDDTDGHVDDITRFVSENCILTMVEGNKGDENYKPLQENLKRLNKMHLEIIEVEMPRPIIIEDVRVCASYANFYIGNKVVLVPTFQDPNDQKAVDTLFKCFPTRKIVPIDASDLIWGLGAFHCATQQQPI